jgi:hypothetical protein
VMMAFCMAFYLPDGGRLAAMAYKVKPG